MILQALTQHYETLRAAGKVEAPGWNPQKISYAIELNEDGEIQKISSLLQEVDVGKKSPKIVLRPRNDFSLPAAVIRTSGAKANFLWDNATYMLGIAHGGASKHIAKCYSSAKNLHLELLKNVKSPASHAILAFFNTWNPEAVELCPPVQEKFEELTSGVNLVFMVNGEFAHEDLAIRDVWQKHYDNASDGPQQRCLVTGEMSEIAEVHPSIKGVKGAQPSGAALVTFNAESFCSYGKDQGNNAPISKKAAFAYTTALNHLISDSKHRQIIGNTTIVYWSETDEEQYADFVSSVMGTNNSDAQDEDITAVIQSLAHGVPCEDLKLDPARTFYVLGIDANASRLIVRFFLHDTFGEFMKNVAAHHDRLRIQLPSFEKTGLLPSWRLLLETVSAERDPSPNIVTALDRAIWFGEPYPAALLTSVLNRIRADANVNWRRAAIIKAFFLRNSQDENLKKEVCTVSLNEQSRDVAYTLGRLFSIYEGLQCAAIPNLNATIKDRLYRGASTTPAVVFPKLARMSQIYLSKLKGSGLRVVYDKQITALKDIIGETYPMRLNLVEQGSFDLGYYHQNQRRFTKKEEKNNEPD